MKGNFEDHDDMVCMCIYSIKQAYMYYRCMCQERMYHKFIS